MRLIKFKRPLPGEDSDLVPLRDLKHLEFIGIDYTARIFTNGRKSPTNKRRRRITASSQPFVVSFHSSGAFLEHGFRSRRAEPLDVHSVCLHDSRV